jgi:hypothetical protein
VAQPCPDDPRRRSGPVPLPLLTERHAGRQGFTCLVRPPRANRRVGASGYEQRSTSAVSPPGLLRSNEMCTWSKWFSVSPPRSDMRSQPSP